MFLVYIVSKFFFFAFVLARYCFAINSTIFETIDFFILMFRVFLVEFEIVALLALLATNLILINKLHKFLCEAIKIKKTIKSFKLNILNKIVRCKVREEFQDLKFCRLMNFKSIIESTKSSSRLSIDLIIIK